MSLVIRESVRWNNYYILFFILAIISFGISAWINVGYLHYDEHYQILEFANYKRGFGNITHLPWEYQSRLRPAIQPFLAYIFLAMDLIMVRDPYHQAFILRVISGAFSIFCIYRFFVSAKGTISRPLLIFLFFASSFLFYRLPYIGVRFSSENWSTCFLLLGISLLFKYVSTDATPFNGRIFFFIGILFGLSFLFRYQSAILLVGLALWACVFRYREIKYWMIMFTGFILVFLLGILIDHWYYDEWVLTIWNYFRVNLMEGKASEFGTEPWWWYLKTLRGSGGAQLVDIPVLFFVLLFLIREFKNPITWMLLLFLIVHFLIPHKELRFISPLYYFVPYMIVRSLDYIYSLLQERKIVTYAIVLIAGVNSVALVAIILKSPDLSMEIYKYLRTVGNRPIQIYHDSGLFSSTLSNRDGNISPDFYKGRQQFHIQEKLVNQGYLEAFANLPVNRDTLQYLILSDPEEQEMVDNRLEIAYDPDHSWVKKLNYRNWMRRGYCKWKLYKKKSATTLVL